MTSRLEPDSVPVHVPVMVDEVLEFLQPRAGSIIVDATLGGGGHAAAILERIGDEGKLVGIDRDAVALTATRRRLGEDSRVVFIHGDYRDLSAHLKRAGVGPVDGLLADLGISTLQLDGMGRGFAFKRDEPLDMRMDQSRGSTAAEWLAQQDQESLERVLRNWGDENRFARRIARMLLRRQEEHGPFETTGQLRDAIAAAVPRHAWPRRIHPATKSFQAIRIAVNDELRGLEKFVDDATEALCDGGRLAVISFHSLEDRPIKAALRRLEGQCICPPDLPVCGCHPVHHLELLNRSARKPTPEEVEANPRSRSARLRAARRCIPEEVAA